MLSLSLFSICCLLNKTDFIPGTSSLPKNPPFGSNQSKTCSSATSSTSSFILLYLQTRLCVHCSHLYRLFLAPLSKNPFIHHAIEALSTPELGLIGSGFCRVRIVLCSFFPSLIIGPLYNRSTAGDERSISLLVKGCVSVYECVGV